MDKMVNMKKIPIIADTKRFIKNNNVFTFLNYSFNRGLECYLGEALARLGDKNAWIQKELDESLKRIFDQGVYYKDYMFWRWEREPSIMSVYFPLDWDDTSKAIDFIYTCKKNYCFNFDFYKLPNFEIWEDEIKKSLFYSNKMGVDVVLETNNDLALSVFFGDLSSKWPKREDPMVTISTIRTTFYWFHETFKKMENEFHRLIFRQSDLVMELINNSMPFEKLSKYYFSLGHYIFRFIETILLIGYDFLEIGLDINIILNRINKTYLSILDNHSDTKIICDEEKWWVLIGIQLDIIEKDDLLDNLFFKYSNFEMNMIFRHRRLEHYYTADKWTQKLQEMEYINLMRSKKNKNLRK